MQGRAKAARAQAAAAEATAGPQASDVDAEPDPAAGGGGGGRGEGAGQRRRPGEHGRHDRQRCDCRQVRFASYAFTFHINNCTLRYLPLSNFDAMDLWTNEFIIINHNLFQISKPISLNGVIK